MIDLTAVRGRHAERWPQRARQWRTTAGRMIGRAAFVARAAGTPVAAQLRAAWEGSGTLRLVTLGLVVALAYYAGAWLGFLLVFPGSPLSILWPPNAIVLAALLLVPPQKWWIVLLGVLPAHLVVEWQSGVAPLAVPGLYVTNCGEALLGATLVRRWSSGGPPWLGTWRQVVVYVVGAAIAAPFVASFLDTGVVVATRWSPQGYWLLWEERFISAVLTNLTVAPVILLLASGAWQRWQRWRQGPQWWPWRTLPRQRAVEMALLALSILASGYVAFSLPTATPQNTPELLYALAPVLLWAAVRFGVGGISASLLALALLAAGWANASGLFVARAPAAAVVTLQLFLIALGAPALCLAALVQERERDAEMLRASEARYRATFESAAIGVAVVDLTGRPVEVNAYVSQMVGYTADELRAMALRDFTHPDDVADNETLLGSALTGAIGSYQLEKRYRHKDGHTVWGRVSASLVRDRDGQPAYVVVHLEDVTPRKQLEQEREAARAEAERQAEELDRVFEQSAEGLAVYDATGQLVRTNAALRTLLGLDAAPLHYWQLSLTERARLFQAQSLDGRLLATDEAPVQRALHGAVIAGADALEMALHTEDGREVVLSASAAPLRDRAGRIVGAVGVIRDQTERARLEREREAARAAAEAQAEELDRIFEQMTEALMVYDADGHIVRENAAMRRVRGADVAPPGDGQLPASERLKWYVLRDAAGRPFKIEDTPQLRALRGEELTGERAVDLRMRSLDGRDLELRVSATPLRDAAGRIVGAVSSGVDLTERNRLMREREEALEASETWFHSVSDTAPVFIWTTDTEGLATFVNLPWLHLTGQTLEHELGEGWMEGIHLDDYERCVQTYWTAVENRQPFTMDYRIRCADGEYRWLVTTGVPRVAPDGAFLGYIGSAIDISERRQLEAEREEALVASEAWFRALADTAPVLVWVSGVDGLVTFVNLPWMQFSGRTMEQELGDGWAEGVHPDDYARCLQTYRTAFDARQPFTMEYRLRRADGEYRWLVDTGVPRFGPNRTFLGYIGSAMDITERRQLEAEREEARIQAERRAEELDRVFETMTDGVAVYDQHGQVVRANAALQRLLGLDAAPPSYAERSLLERVALFDPRDEHGQSLAPADLPVPRALAGRATGGAESMVMRMRTLDGREVELLVSAAPLHSPTEELVGAVSVYHDLTERNRLAHEQEEGRARELALREVNQRLDTFVSMAAHDLRRPVAVSRMRIELTQRQVQKAAVNVRSTAEQAQPFIQVAHDLEVARQSLDRLTGFMEQLLDVTRARQDHLALNRQPCDLVALVRACVEEQRLLAPGRRLTLDLPLDQPGARPSATPQEPQEPQEPPAVMVHADAARLGQVVVNYLTNAERYSPADQSIELSLRVIEQAVEQATDVAPVCVARVSVRDHGPGIALDAQHAIWERFQRAHTLREAMGTGGLGLGLYIARMIITLHGGQVGVESTPGEGATFWFTLPLSAAKE